jgi:AraC-like DNA-binding protein
MIPVVEQAMFDVIPGMLGGECISSPRVLILRAGAKGVTLSTVDNGGDDMQRHVFGPGWAGLVVLDRIACEVLSGRGEACDVEVAALAKLQAFLDAAQGSDNAGAGVTVAAAVAVAAPAMIAVGFPTALDTRDWPAIERWLLEQSVGIDANVANAPKAADNAANDCFNDFAYLGAALRTTEHYKLVRFLLSQPASRSLQELSVEYGLSYSHFRKLCRAALGRGGKAEFQYWRNVRALLDLIDGGSLTDVALRQGFASSSHFSDAMKGQFGIAPRYLTRALDIGKQ